MLKSIIRDKIMSYFTLNNFSEERYGFRGKRFKVAGSSKCAKVAKDSKRKAKETVKAQRKQAKQLRQDENSQQARLDYSRYDGGENATEITTDLSHQQLYNLMSEFYAAKVKITESQGNVIIVDTTGQGSNDDSLYKWLAERRCHITDSNEGSIAKRRPTTKVSCTVKHILYTKFKLSFPLGATSIREPSQESKRTWHDIYKSLQRSV